MATVEITETSIHTYEIDNVNSLEEAVTIAEEKFESGEEADDIDILDVIAEAFEREEN